MTDLSQVIPEELRQHRAWLLWRYEPNPDKPGKPRKVPHYVNGLRRRGQQGSERDRSRLASFDEAYAALLFGGNAYSGIGFAMLPDWGLVGLDFDDCVTPDGAIHPEVLETIGATYAEISPSGKGVRAFVQGEIPDRKSHADGDMFGFETFHSKGFLTITGKQTDIYELAGAGVMHLNGSVTGLFGRRFTAAALTERQPSSAPAPSIEEIANIRSMLDVIAVWCNDGRLMLNRDKWRAALYAIHSGSGGSEEGWQLAHEWSRSIPDYGPEALDAIWDKADRERVGGIGMGTLVVMAKECGWVNPATLGSPPDEADFGVVVRPESMPGEPAEPEPFPAYARDRPTKSEPVGEIKPILRNVLAAMRRPDICGFQISYDEFTDEVMLCPYPKGKTWEKLRDGDLVKIRETLEFHGFKQAPKELVRDAVTEIVLTNRFDSAQNWLNSVVPTWDGVRRIDTFLFTYMGAADTPYTRAVSRYMWTALAGRVLHPGIKADMAPIYEGLQGVKKSTVISALAPLPAMFTELELSEKDDDIARKMKGVVVCELGELSGMAARELEWVKKFQSRTQDKWVPKFMERAAVYPRRSINIGSTNRTDILVDDTGNRRWLPVHVERADVDGIVRDREQLWAEGAVMFNGEHGCGFAGGVAWQDAEQLATVEHEAYMVRDAWEAPVRAWLGAVESMPADAESPDRVRGAAPFTLSALMSGALNMSVRDMDRVSQKRVSSILRTLGYVGKSARIDSVVTWAWVKVGC